MKSESLYRQFSFKGRWFADRTIEEDERMLINAAKEKYDWQKSLDSVDFMDHRNEI